MVGTFDTFTEIEFRMSLEELSGVETRLEAHLKEEDIVALRAAAAAVQLRRDEWNAAMLTSINQDVAEASERCDLWVKLDRPRSDRPLRIARLAGFYLNDDKKGRIHPAPVLKDTKGNSGTAPEDMRSFGFYVGRKAEQ